MMSKFVLALLALAVVELSGTAFAEDAIIEELTDPTDLSAGTQPGLLGRGLDTANDVADPKGINHVPPPAFKGHTNIRPGNGVAHGFGFATTH